LWFLGIAVATLPVALGLSDVAGGRVNGMLLVFGGGLVTALVMVRIRWLSVERLRAEQSLRHLASHDALTDLANRREFMDQLTHERSGGRRNVLLFCDLDRFKDVNDQLGHSAGDRLLVEVANRLVSAVRESDTVARLGGDEFIILLRSADQAEVAAILDRISALLSQPIEVSGRSVDVDASIGVVAAHDGDPEELLKLADHAMYRAKQAAPTERGVRVVTA
jgi:diguanylate cyclase (GGDEF)-like protein